jgi:hypothetical protein
MFPLSGAITWLVSEARQTASLDSSGTANHVTWPCGWLRKLVRLQVQTPWTTKSRVQVLCSYWLEHDEVSRQNCIEMCRQILRSHVGSRTGGLGQRWRIISSHCHRLMTYKCLVERYFRQVPAHRKYILERTGSGPARSGWPEMKSKSAVSSPAEISRDRSVSNPIPFNEREVCLKARRWKWLPIVS